MGGCKGGPSGLPTPPPPHFPWIFFFLGGGIVQSPQFFGPLRLVFTGDGVGVIVGVVRVLPT